MQSTDTHDQVLAKMRDLYQELCAHDGFGELRIEVRLLRRGQKEVILHCGKQYRYVVDHQPPPAESVLGPWRAEASTPTRTG